MPSVGPVTAITFAAVLDDPARFGSAKQWALHIAGRRGKRIAAVALARKLAATLFAMARDNANFVAAASPEQAAA